MAQEKELLAQETIEDDVKRESEIDLDLYDEKKKKKALNQWKT